MANVTMPSWIDENYACATHFSQQADGFHTKQLVDTTAKFPAKAKFTLQYNNRGELMPVWPVPAWHFVVISWNKYSGWHVNIP